LNNNVDVVHERPAARKAEEVRLAALRRLSPARKLEVIFEMWEFGFKLRVAGVKDRFPGLTEDKARRRAVAEMVEKFKKESGRRSPLFDYDDPPAADDNS